MIVALELLTRRCIFSLHRDTDTDVLENLDTCHIVVVIESFWDQTEPASTDWRLDTSWTA